MLSQKLQKDLMNAYAAVHEEKRGHASGDSDVEKQASQLASDVRYKAKGKVKPGTSDEEKKKVFLQILGASPAPSSVKAMARQKLLGEEVVLEDKKMAKQSDDDLSAAHKKFSGMDQSTPSNKFMLKRIEKEMKKRKSVKEGTSYGMYKGSGKPSGAMSGFAKEEESDTPKEKLAKKMKTKKVNRMIARSAKSEKKLAKELMGEMKAPRTQKGAMAYDGPNKERSEAADRVIAKTKAKRKKMKEDFVDEKKLVHGNYGNYVSGQKTSKKTETPMTPDQRYKIPEGKMDPVGQEDGDINNDGKKDGADKYLASRRKAIGKAIAKKRGKVKEGFSAWRIDLDFNEQVKK